MKFLSIALLLCSQSLFAADGFYYTTGTLEVYKNELAKKSTKIVKFRVRLDSDRDTQCLLTFAGPETTESFNTANTSVDPCSLHATDLVSLIQRQGIDLKDIKGNVHINTGLNCGNGFWGNRCTGSTEFKTSNPRVTYTVETNVYRWKKL